MIKLTKTAEPEILRRNAIAWTTEILAGEDRNADKYRHAQIKAALKVETNGKCAYCESKPLHVAHGDVEHIHPKSGDRALTFQWSNLTLACGVCNTKKGTQSDLIDPYEHDPEDHFAFRGAFMMTKQAGDEAARKTVIAIGLNRPDLLERRNERIMNLDRQRHDIANTRDPQLRDMLILELYEDQTHHSKEFAACAKDFVNSLR